MQTAKTPPSAVSGPVVCPECGKAFKTLAGLGGHRAYFHKAPKEGTGAAKPQVALTGQRAPTHSAVKKGANAAEHQPPAVSHPSFLTPSLNSAHEHLRAAREALAGRHQQIEDELKRITELQADKERVQRELDAVNTALQAFSDNT